MSGLKQSIRVPLTVPIEAHGETVSSLELRRPKLGDLEGVEISIIPKPEQETAEIKLKVGDVIPIVAAMAKIPPSAARSIDGNDVGEVIGAVWDFLPKSLGTGKT